MAPNLQKRGDVYYARIAVPKSLRDLREAANIEPNPAEICKSLRTPDRNAAERLLLTVKAELLRAFDLEEERLRREGVRPLADPTADDFASMKEEFFLDVLGRDEQSRLARKSVAEIEQMRADLIASLKGSPVMSEREFLTMPGVGELMSAKDAAEDAAINRNILRKELQKHLAQQNFVLVSDTLEAMARERGLAIEPNSLNYRLLGKQLLGAWQAALKVADRRDEGIADEVAAPLPMASPAPPLPAGASSGSVVELKPKQGKPAKGESLKDYFGRYLKEQKADMPLPSQRELWATLRLFVECNGDHPVASYTKAHMAAFKTALQAYPKNAAKLYPGIKFTQAVERNRKDGHPIIAYATQRNKLSTISAFGTWLESNADGVDAANFNTTLPRRTDRRRMEPFSLDEVRQVLNSSAFVGCESDKNYQKPGSFKLRVVLRGPGGSITLNDGGITIEGVVIFFKGPVIAQSEGMGNVFGIHGSPKNGEQADFCLECFLHAAALGGGLVPA